MTTTSTANTEQVVSAPTEHDARAAAQVVEQDLLVEDVSIDGMCGVY